MVLIKKIKTEVKKGFNKNKLIMIIPLISLILAIISLIIPTVYISFSFNFAPIETYIWIFGLTYNTYTGFTFLPNYELLWSFLSSMIIILAIYSLIQNIRYIIKDQEKYDYIKFWLAWIICGSFLIFSAFIYWIIYPYLFSKELTEIFKIGGQEFEIPLGVSICNIWYYYFLRRPLFLILSGIILAITGATYKFLYFFNKRQFSLN